MSDMEVGEGYIPDNFAFVIEGQTFSTTKQHLEDSAWLQKVTSELFSTPSLKEKFPQPQITKVRNAIQRGTNQNALSVQRTKGMLLPGISLAELLVLPDREIQKLPAMRGRVAIEIYRAAVQPLREALGTGFLPPQVNSG